MHSFEPNIAQRVGISAAVIYQNISWWCQKNAANERNIIDGLAWSYNSVRAFTTLFPYLTAKQVRKALTVLEDEGLILVANHNTDPRDRTKWYAICVQNSVPDPANGSAPQGKAVCPPGQNTFAPQGKPLPVSKPDIKPDGKPYAHRDAAGECVQQDLLPALSDQIGLVQCKLPYLGGLADGCETIDDEFAIVWNHYPRKVDKQDARTAWAKARKTNTFETIAKPLGVFIRVQKGSDISKIPYLTSWLNKKRWEGDQTHARSRAETTTDRLNRLGAVSTENQCDAIAGPRRKPPQIELRMDP